MCKRADARSWQAFALLGPLLNRRADAAEAWIGY
jgi:hypothetical protein